MDAVVHPEQLGVALDLRSHVARHGVGDGAGRQVGGVFAGRGDMALANTGTNQGYIQQSDKYPLLLISEMPSPREVRELGHSVRFGSLAALHSDNTRMAASWSKADGQ